MRRHDSGRRFKSANSAQNSTLALNMLSGFFLALTVGCCLRFWCQDLSTCSNMLFAMVFNVPVLVVFIDFQTRLVVVQPPGVGFGHSFPGGGGQHAGNSIQIHLVGGHQGGIEYPGPLSNDLTKKGEI